MYAFFVGFDEVGGAPSLEKFARSVGATVAELESFRSHREFDASYRECSEIRRDYLIDRALCRRFDPSLVKFLVADEAEEDGGGELEIKLEVVE